ncbi:MAG: hypothetical protein AAGE65_14940 [Planctomycetota bacterium]
MNDSLQSPEPAVSAELPEEVQATFDAHLDAVDAVLVRYGQSRSQRSAVTDELDGQLRDMLAARCEGRAPSVEDAEAVLSEVEPAEAFARKSIDLDASPSTGFTGFAEDDGPPPKTSGWAIAGLVFNALTILAIPMPALLTLIYVLSLSQTDYTGQPQARQGAVMMIFSTLGPILIGLMLGALAVACGIVAMGKIKAAPRHVGGWGLAVFDVVFVPFWVASGLLCVLVWSGMYLGLQVVKLVSGKTNVFEDGMRPSTSSELSLVFLLSLPLGGLLAAWVTRAVVRRLNAWRRGEPGGRL